MSAMADDLIREASAHEAQPSVDPVPDRRPRLPWPLDFDACGWTLGILPHIQLWPGSIIRDPCRRCGSSVMKYTDLYGIGETEVRFGDLGNQPVKGKYHVSISIQPSFTAADSELHRARELTAKNGTIAILTTLAWASRMILGPDHVPGVFVLDGIFHGKTLAWFVWGPDKSKEVGKWQRLTKGK
jgi:hypothetical protein